MIHYKDLSDSELVGLFRSGNREAFAGIFNKYWAPLVLHANNILKDEDMAQDVVQDVFAEFLKLSRQVEIKDSIKPYLYSAVRNRVFNAIAHEKIKVNYLEAIFDYVPACHADSEFHLKELTEIIDAEIESMPPRMQEIFNLSRKEHLSHKEIAKLLGISENTVNTQIQRAIKTLRSNKDIGNYMAVIAYLIVEIQKQ